MRFESKIAIAAVISALSLGSAFALTPPKNAALSTPAKAAQPKLIKQSAHHAGHHHAGFKKMANHHAHGVQHHATVKPQASKPTTK